MGEYRKHQQCIIRLWNNEQTLTAVLDLGVGANGTQIRLTEGTVAINSVELKVNTINSNGANDVVFQRNDTTFFSLQVDGGTNLMNFASNGGVSANQVHGIFFQTGGFQLIQFLKALIPQVMEELNI